MVPNLAFDLSRSHSGYFTNKAVGYLLATFLYRNIFLRLSLRVSIQSWLDMAHNLASLLIPFALLTKQGIRIFLGTFFHRDISLRLSVRVSLQSRSRCSCSCISEDPILSDYVNCVEIGSVHIGTYQMWSEILTLRFDEMKGALDVAFYVARK